MAAVGSLKCTMIAGRTDSAGVAQDDWDQEEVRMIIAAIFRDGILFNPLDATPNLNAYRVRQDTGSNMQVKVGSGTTKTDLIVVGSDATAGQGRYLIRLDATTLTVTVPATDGALAQRYGVYVWVDDAAYGGTASRAYASISCIRGTPSGSPTTPSPLAAWSASYLLWEFQLPAGATAVTDAILDQASSIDQRTHSHPVMQDWLETQVFS